VRLDRAALARAVAREGRVARVAVVEARGSAPRGPGAEMLVWAEGQSGTIGGGALEWEAAAHARGLLAEGRDDMRLMPLGPALGQCCGGAVRLLWEIYDAERLAQVPRDGLHARPLPGGGAGPRPQAPGLGEGWIAEAVGDAHRQLWIWGAGHVGRALVGVLAPLPDLAICWADTGPGRFPATVPEGVEVLPAADLPRLAGHAPPEAEHLILTYSHDIDLALCDALVRRGFAACGLIGSATKQARFRSRLAAMGHGEAAIARIRCPIGDPALGKHPQAIAVGVAREMLLARDAPSEPGRRSQRQ
jgi:xanthine dehydrogenase accessory factor